MTTAELSAQIYDRFSRWGKLMRNQRAVPLLSVGMTVGKTDRFILTAAEELSNREVLDILNAVTDLVKSGAFTEVGKEGPP